MPDIELNARTVASASDEELRRALKRKSDAGSLIVPLARSSKEVDFGQAREEMIRVAAYFLAERRGFSPGAELDDWLEAEASIDRRLNE